MAVAARLRRVCEVKDTGPTEIAKALSIRLGIEVSQQRVSSWLAGSLPNDPTLLVAFYSHLGVDANYVLEGRTDGLSVSTYRLLHS